MIDKYTKLGIINRKFFYENTNYKRNIFSKEFNSVISKYKRLTKRLSKYLINISLTQSTRQTHRVINKLIPVIIILILRISKNYEITAQYNY